MQADRAIRSRSSLDSRQAARAFAVKDECLQAFVRLDLLRIVQEAISNAVTQPKPTVISNSINIVLEVTDNGSGMADSAGFPLEARLGRVL
jgi:hypothetical protein